MGSGSKRVRSIDNCNMCVVCGICLIWCAVCVVYEISAFFLRKLGITEEWVEECVLKLVFRAFGITRAKQKRLCVRKVRNLYLVQEWK